MIQHCLGNSQIKSIPEERVLLHLFFPEQTQMFTRYKQREIEEILTLKNLTFPLTQSTKVHRRALVYSLPYSLPSLWKIDKRISQLSPFDQTTWQPPRENPRTCRGFSRGYMTSGGRNLLPPHGFGPGTKTRGGIIVSPAYTYKECVKYWCSMRINPDLKKLGAHGGPG